MIFKAYVFVIPKYSRAGSVALSFLCGDNNKGDLQPETTYLVLENKPLDPPMRILCVG